MRATCSVGSRTSAASSRLLSRFDTRKKLPNADHQDDVYELANLGQTGPEPSTAFSSTTADRQAGCLGEFGNFSGARSDDLRPPRVSRTRLHSGRGLRFITWEEIMLKAVPIRPGRRLAVQDLGAA